MVLTPKSREHLLAIDYLWKQECKISAIKLLIEFQKCTIVEAKVYLQERHRKCKNVHELNGVSA